jgi:CheY-like chemotaxis protein
MLPEVKHILIAEDDADDIDFFKEAVKDNCPSIELTVGKDCLKEIRKKEKFQKVPIVVYSTSSNQYDVEYCLSNGANHYVVKPGTYSAISKLVHQLCNGTLAA